MDGMAEDVVEQILVVLDVKDLIRCKSVCKSWQSLISTPSFVISHLKHSYKNDCDNHELGHRRIGNGIAIEEHFCLSLNFLHVVGSCNGLVCVSLRDVEFAVTNPSTREFKKLQTPPVVMLYAADMPIRKVVCWGFGYDSSADDYKVIAGFRERFSNNQTLFYVLTLKSNIWKLIGEVNYRCIYGVTGILCGGALHWFMTDANNTSSIISLDLSTQEFKEIPQPAHGEYVRRNQHKRYQLGVLEECLCLFSYSSSGKKWVMKNNKWEPLIDHCESKYDVVHSILESQKTVYPHDDGMRIGTTGISMSASIFVKSLVSPHPYGHGQESNESVEGGVNGNIRKRNIRRKRCCKHKKPLVWI